MLIVVNSFEIPLEIPDVVYGVVTIDRVKIAWVAIDLGDNWPGLQFNILVLAKL